MELCRASNWDDDSGTKKVLDARCIFANCHKLLNGKSSLFSEMAGEALSFQENEIGESIS
jgi:hypothetical protein